MPAHDIIDNRSEKLVDHINRILDSSDAARFAVGYFFLSGLTDLCPVWSVALCHEGEAKEGALHQSPPGRIQPAQPD